MSEPVDSRQVLERYSDRGVFEVNQIVGIWEVRIDSCPIRLKIKVMRGVDGMYLGMPNYSIRRSSQTPHLQQSAQEAVEDALRRFLSSFDAAQIDQSSFELDEDF